MAQRDKFREDVATNRTKVAKKPRKKRNLSEEQKAAMVERMKKAREARGPAKNLSIAESIRDLKLEDPLHPNKVKDWIKYQKDILKSVRHMKDSKDAKERNLFRDTEVYVSNLQKYLNDGIYRDYRYGEEKQNNIKQRSVAMAYYSDGTPKRTVGIFYQDIADVYTQEMETEDYATRKELFNKERIRKDNRKNREKS